MTRQGFGAPLPPGMGEALIRGWEADEKNARQKAARESEKAEQTQKERLLGLAGGHYLFTDERDCPFVWLERESHREVVPLESSRFKNWLSLRFYQETGGAPSASVLADTLGVLCGQARFEGSQHRLANRLARDDAGSLWVDMADDRWRAARVDVGGWTVEDDPPLLFRRYSHQKPHVDPALERKSLREELGPFLNVRSGDDLLLVLVWLVAALIPDIPRAILVPHGPQGSAKSTLTRILRMLIDPSSVPMPRFPRNEPEMVQVLDHHAAPFFDNLSSISDYVSDTLCRAVTGEGFSKRKLYSNDDDILYFFRRALVLNGINIPAQRPDLLDRCVLVRLDRIPEDARRDEQGFWKAFEHARPRILAAMLDAMVGAMGLEPSVQLETLPRMADWSRWGFAISETLGFGGEAFLSAYRENRTAQNEEALTSHPVGAAVAVFMQRHREWSGQPSELLRELEHVADEEKIDRKQKLWPRAPNWLARRLNEVETNLREDGIRFEETRGTHRLLRLWREGSEDAVDGDATDGSDPAHRETAEKTGDQPDTSNTENGEVPVGNDGTDSSRATELYSDLEGTLFERTRASR